MKRPERLIAQWLVYAKLTVGWNDVRSAVPSPTPRSISAFETLTGLTSASLGQEPLSVHVCNI